MSSTPSGPEAAFRANRWILWALAGGVVLFASVVSVIEPIGVDFEPVLLGLDVLGIVALVVTVQALVLSYFLPPRMVAAAKDGDTTKRVAIYGTSRIVAGALCEGPALLGCVAMLLSGNRWYLAPIALLVVAIVQHAPTRDSFEEATGVRLTGLEA